MQMKEDHMHNRSLKPGYNVQIGTENQMIVGFSFHQTSTDSPTLIPHLQQLKKNLGKLPPTWIADAGYGGEENYLALLAEQITPYVKYSFFEKDRKKRRKISEKEKCHLRQFRYDEQTDTFVCPQGKPLFFDQCIHDRSATGFISEKEPIVVGIVMVARPGRPVQNLKMDASFSSALFMRICASRYLIG